MPFAAAIVLPHQLSEKNPVLRNGVPVYLVEEFLFFRQYRFHQQKILLHRASMKSYEQWLKGKGFRVIYIDSQDPRSDIRELIRFLAQGGITELDVTDPADNWAEKRIRASCKKAGIQCRLLPSPQFLEQPGDWSAYFDKRKTYFQTDFYLQQRRRRNLLLDDAGKPVGGKWTYDTENRKRWPKNAVPPAVRKPAGNRFVKEAAEYVRQFFPGNYGTTQSFHYPVNFDDAKAWLADFLENRLAGFGPYEDAMVVKEDMLHHSVLTPLLNTGLLTPQQVLEQTLETASRKEIPLSSLEGFIRQLTGWREFIRIVYEREGSKQRKVNYWNFHRKIPASFWTGETGIHPVDTVIRRVLKTGYAHHIERLMVLGNFMLLCEFDPDEVYRWFMEMFIDSYDWVMVPNVYGMSQFADGGLMTTKPYISGSNYLLKMGDWEKGDWQAIWDGLFWRFLSVHRDFFLRQPRMGMLVHTWDKMPVEKKQAHLQEATRFLKKLDT